MLRFKRFFHSFFKRKIIQDKIRLPRFGQAKYLSFQMHTKLCFACLSIHSTYMTIGGTLLSQPNFITPIGALLLCPLLEEGQSKN